MRCIASCFWKLFWAKKSTTLCRSSANLVSLIDKVERWRGGDGSLCTACGGVGKSHCGMRLTSKDSCWWIQENVVVWFFKPLAQRHRVNVPIDGYRVSRCYSSSLWRLQITVITRIKQCTYGLIDLVLSLVWNLLLVIILVYSKSCNYVIRQHYRDTIDRCGVSEYMGVQFRKTFLPTFLCIHQLGRWLKLLPCYHVTMIYKISIFMEKFFLFSII